MKIHDLKTLMNKSLDDVSYLRDYGSITEELWAAYYYLWYHGRFKYGGHYLPESLETIRNNLSPGNLLVFQEYVERFKIVV